MLELKLIPKTIKNDAYSHCVHEPTSYPVRALANILDYCWLTKLMVTGSIYNKNHELVLDQEKPYPKIWGQGKLSKVKYLPWTPLVKDQREVNCKYFDPVSKYLSKKALEGCIFPPPIAVLCIPPSMPGYMIFIID